MLAGHMSEQEMAYKLTRYHHPSKFRRLVTEKQHVILLIAVALAVLISVKKQNYDTKSKQTIYETFNANFTYNIANIFREVQLMKKMKKIAKLNNSQRIIAILLLILSNDINLNPGPEGEEPCSMCSQPTNEENSMKCETCSRPCHLSCSEKQSNVNPNDVANVSFEWICPNLQCRPNHQVRNNQQEHISPNRYTSLSNSNVQSQEPNPPKPRKRKERCKSTYSPATQKSEEPPKSREEEENCELLKELPGIEPKHYEGKDLCRFCTKEVTNKQQAVSCDRCEMWTHRRCSDMSVKVYNYLKKKKRFTWKCKKCRKDEPIIKDKTDKSKLNKEQMPEPLEDIRKSGKELLVIHINCRSLVNKEEELQQIIDEISPDIICLTETWFDDSVPSQAFVPENYSIIRKDREEAFKQMYGRNKGGGVAVLHKQHIKVEKKTYLTEKVEEILWVQVRTKQSFMLGTIYRAEYTDILKSEGHESILEENIRKAAEITDNIIVTGDFNIDMLDPESKDTQALKDSYEGYNLEQHILKPTRVNKSNLKPSIIDHIWASSASNLIKSTGTFDGISDHMGIYMRLNQNSPDIPDSKIIFRNYKNYNAEQFCAELAENLESSSIEDHLNNNDVNSATEEMIRVIQETAQKHAPLVEKKCKNHKKSVPWFTSELKNMIKSKNELITDYFTTGYQFYKERIKALCNNINYQKRELKKEYINDQLDKANGNSKEVWKVYNETTKRTKSKETIEPDLMSQEKADKFNRFFATIGLDIQKKLQSQNQPTTDPEDTDNSETSNPSQPHFQFKNETIPDIEKLIDNIRNDVAIGEDMIGAKLIKDMKKTISTILSKIINKGYETNTFPDSMKKAAIKPIHKKGNIDEISNYRPISILPTLSKIFEKAAANQIVSYLEKNKILHPSQHAYQRCHSTITCLIEVLTYVYKLIDQKITTAIISLDLSKAFDSIDHRILLKKLSKMGLEVTAVTWIKSYLTNRKQISKFKHFKSKEEIVHSGIPQGSIVGPLLFLCYTNDFHEALSDECQTFAYADDTQLVIKASNLKQLRKKAEKVVSLAQKWYQDNIMKNNIGKTEVIVINTSQRNQYIQIKVKDEGKDVTIKSKQHIELLGVIIDNNLNWKKQVMKVKRNAFNVTRNIHRVNHLLPEKHRLNLYHAIISPQFSYADIVWGGCNQVEKMSLQRVQNFAAKSITGNKKYDSATNSLKHLKLLNLEQRLSIHETVFAHKAIEGKLSANINKIYKDHLSTGNTRQATNQKLTVPAHKTSKFQRSPLYRTIMSWNKCPISISKENIRQHKKQHQAHLISTTYPTLKH